MSMEALPNTDKNEFKECLHLAFTRPYILRLAASAGIGGLLVGYDTGVISGALLYIRDDFPDLEHNSQFQEGIVSSAIMGAILGAGFGGWLNDKLGRRSSILFADIIFFMAAIFMSIAHSPYCIFTSRIFIGFAVGIASMTSPLYISEASPPRIRGALVSLNALLVTFGQFVAYLTNLAFAEVPGTWRWMFGVACFPALIQFMLILYLPESPRWLYRKGQQKEASEILEKLYPAEEVEHELMVMKLSIQAELCMDRALDDADLFTKIKEAWRSTIVRRALIAGIGLQVAQQFVGINTVTYYAPTIVKLAGFASNTTAMSLSLIIAGLNAIGPFISMGCVDKFGRRTLLLISLAGVTFSLFGLFGAFYVAAHDSPCIDELDTAQFGNNTCPTYTIAQNVANLTPNVAKVSCHTCLRFGDCGFCANPVDKMQPGACLLANPSLKDACEEKTRKWYSEGCPSEFGYLALTWLGLYIIFFSPGMGTVPWLVNSEIYPLRHRSICGGMASMSNWVSNLIISHTFLTLNDLIGPFTYFLYACVAIGAMFFIYFFVPETKGLSFEEVEYMLRDNNMRYTQRRKLTPSASRRALIIM